MLDFFLVFIWLNLIQVQHLSGLTKYFEFGGFFMAWSTKSKFLSVSTMHHSILWMVAPIAALLILTASDLALAQSMKVKRQYIQPNQILTIRMYYHPSLTPPQAVMDIFLKDPKQPVFRLNGDNGNIVETFRYMQELALMFKKQSFTLIFDASGHRTQTVHPYFTPGNFSRKMYNIVGFYGIGYPAHGPVPSGEQPSTNMVPAQPIPMMHDQPPPDEQMGFCCLHGEVVEAPAHECEMERGAFFRDLESANMHCQTKGRQ